MGTKYDIDNLLSDALYRDEKPDARLVYKLKNQQPKGGNNLYKKRRVARSFSTMAAAFILLLVLTTTVLAAGLYMGAFDRLRDLIGEQADLLTPIEITNMPDSENGATTTNNSNVVNHTDEIRVELVAVGIFDNVVDVYLTLEDLICNRLVAGHFSVRHEITFAESDGNLSNRMAMATMGEIGRTDDGVVTYHIRHYFPQPIDYTTITFSIDNIVFDTYRSAESYDIGGDLSILAAENTATTKAVIENLTATMGSDLMYQVLEPQLRTTGLNILVPHGRDTKIGVDAASTRISNMGFIDGRLHVQLYEPNGNEAFLFTASQDDMMWIPSLELAFSFDIDEDGNFIHTYDRHLPYRELIFSIDMDRIAEYRLLANFIVQNTIDIGFNATFEAENYVTRLIVSGLDIPIGAFSINEVRLSPLTIMVQGVDNNPGPGVPQPTIYINTTNGVVETEMRGFLRTFEPIEGWVSSGPEDRGGYNEGFMLTFQMDSVIDMDTVISVEVNGEAFYFD